jgi:hypothetical protein
MLLHIRVQVCDKDASERLAAPVEKVVLPVTR